MLKLLLVDDETGARNKLKRLLSQVKDPMKIEEAANGIEAIEKIKEFEPDLVFLDIQMPGLDGFDVLCHFPDRQFKVVFQTAYDEYALKAFDENAIDYLLKPIGQSRFDKFWQKFLKNQQPNSAEAAEQLHKAGVELKKISVKVGQSLKVIPLEDVFYFLSKDRFVRLYLEDKNFSCNLTLDNLESKLGQNFIRVHRSCLVNADHVGSVLLTTNSTKLKMTNDEEVEVSRSNRKMVKAMFNIDKD